MTASSTSALHVPANVLAELRQAACRAAPNEACGLLAGAAGHITRFYLMTNVDASPDHFSMDPAEQFAAVKDMRTRALRLLAIWHSHPETPARMSAEDLRLAYTPGVAYAILSLVGPQDRALRAFDMADGTPAAMQVIITQ